MKLENNTLKAVNFDVLCMNREFDTFGLVLRMRSKVYSSKDFESLWFLYQAEGLPKNISIEEFCTKHGVLATRRTQELADFWQP